MSGVSSLLRGALLATVLLLPAAGWAATFQDGKAEYDAGDYVGAAELWRQAAEAGDVYAQHALGKLYENGQGVPRDYVQAADWYTRAAAQGLPAAQNNLAMLLASGRGLPRDQALAMKLWEAAAEAGNAHAQYNLGLAYYIGQGVARDDRTAAYWFTLGAQGGLAQAQFAIGQMRRLGLGIARSDAVALVWYDRAAAQGHAEARRMADELRAAGVEPNAQQAAQKPYLSPLMALPPQPPVPTFAVPAPEPQELVDGVMPPPLKPERKVDTSGRGAQEPATQAAAAAPAAAGNSPASQPDLRPDPQGATMVWLGSADDEGQARQLAAALLQRFPVVLAAVPPAPVRQGGGYRVLVGPLTGDEAARELCSSLRSLEPQVFCKVVPRA